MRPVLLACLGLLACNPVESTPVDVDAAPPDFDAAPPDFDAEPAPDASVDAPPPPPRNVAFVSSTTVTGKMGGRDGADAACNQLATAAGLAGTFRAYLSTDAEDAISRIEIARGWVRPDGKPVADTAADVRDGKLFNAIRLDETGAAVPAPLVVWTATRNGRRFATPPTYGTCGNWTTETPTNPDASVPRVLVGEAGHSGGTFSFIDNPQCTSRARFYCFQVNHQTPVAPEPVEARLAFLTKATWLPAGGLAAADALCQKEATDSMVTGTFKAVLPTAGASAVSRFRPADGPWKRKDGVLITAAADIFDDAKELAAPLNVDLQGKYYGAEQVWAGATAGWAVVPASGASTCNDWTSSEVGLTTTARRAGISRKATFAAHCKDARQLMCLETAPPAP